MAVPRSTSTNRTVQRKISSSLANLLQQPNAAPHSKRNRNNNKWAAQIAIVVCFAIVLAYIGFYLFTLKSLLSPSGTDTDSDPQREGERRRKAGGLAEQQASILQHIAAAGKPAASVLADNVRKVEARNVPPKPAGIVSKETLVLSTDVGDIRIVLRPDLSQESVDYVKQLALVQGACGRCSLYRAEKPGILQGILAAKPDTKALPLSTVRKGACPPGYESVANECPEWDGHCGCHGPTMTRGMVGWAAGDTGPDFFIDAYRQPATWWGTQHTVWGELQDDASFAVLDVVWTLPAHVAGELTHLDKPLHFELALVTEDSGRVDRADVA